MRYILAALLFTICGPAQGQGFERIVIDDNFPGAYQVEVADVNGDKKPDVIAVGGGICAWYENPSWKKRIVTGPKQTPGVISSATADIDGDGKAEVAVAYEFSMNEPTKGKLLLATQGKTIDDPWTVAPIADFGSIHRLRWSDFLDLDNAIVIGTNSVRIDHDRKVRTLVVAPIFGPSAKPPDFQQEPAHVTLFTPDGSIKRGRWKQRVIGDAPVLHAIDVVDLDGDKVDDFLAASNLGVSRFAFTHDRGTPVFTPLSLVPGAPGNPPKKGCSEVHVGRLKNGKRFLATVEPWHGTKVAVYLSESDKPLTFSFGLVIDNSLKEGHALWIADVDGDGDDEIFAGFRGPGTSVLMFDFDGKAWNRTVIDNAIAAQDLRGGDLDGDGTPDVVAVGGSTHNVIWYKPLRRPR